MDYYLLSPIKTLIPVSEKKYMEWIKEFGMHNQIAKDTVVIKTGYKSIIYTISTIFLGIDHGLRLKHENNDQPIVFETMVLDDENNEMFQWRYRDFAEAIASHNKLTRHIQTTGNIPNSIDTIYDADEDAGII